MYRSVIETPPPPRTVRIFYHELMNTSLKNPQPMMKKSPCSIYIFVVIMLYSTCPQYTKFESSPLKIEVRGSELGPGPVEIHKSIPQATLRPRFGTCAMKFCVGNSRGIVD